MKHWRIAFFVGMTFTIVMAGIGVRKQLRWKKFYEVQPNVLYRSGMLHSWQLRQLMREKQIKTVFSFTFTHNAEEEADCERAGISRHFQYLSGDGVGPDDPYLAFMKIASDPANHPMLVHCSAGVQRTGGAVALFRCVIQGWEVNRALDEMLAAGNDGNQAQKEQIRRLVGRLAKERAIAGKSTADGLQR